MLIRTTFLVTVILAANAVAYAQDGDRYQRGPFNMVDRIAQALRNRLELDESQQGEFDQIISAFRQSMELNTDGPVGNVWEDMRAARESGDEGRVEELRAQMRERMRRMGESATALLDEVEPILNESQVEVLGVFRAQMAERMRGGDPRQRGERMVAQLREELQLTEEQQTPFDAAVEGLRERGEKIGERFREMGPLFRELREARNTGDTERAAELRAQLEEMRPDPRGLMQGFVEEIAPILDDQQAEVLARYRDRIASGGERRGERDRQREPDVRSILRAAKRIDLDAEQREQLREIESAAGRALREQDREERVELARQTRKEIADLLSEEQRQEFDRLLSGARPERSRERDRARRGSDRKPTDEKQESDRP